MAGVVWNYYTFWRTLLFSLCIWYGQQGKTIAHCHWDLSGPSQNDVADLHMWVREERTFI